MDMGVQKKCISRPNLIFFVRRTASVQLWWMHKFQETGSVADVKIAVRVRTNEYRRYRYINNGSEMQNINMTRIVLYKFQMKRCVDNAGKK